MSKANLCDLRRAKKITQRQLAEKVGVTERTVINYEMDINNLRKASYDTIEKIALVLEVSIDQIFLSTDSEIPKQTA